MAKKYNSIPETIQFNITESELSDFAHTFRLDEQIRARISTLFWLDLYIYSTKFGINASAVIEELQNLECGSNKSTTKKATKFTKPPLCGLWHKHFFTARFLPQNIRNSYPNERLDALVRKIVAAQQSDATVCETASEISRRVIEDGYKERQTSHKLTGEWILFAKHNCLNYYLCLSPHCRHDEDQVLADRIVAHCAPESPFIRTIIHTGK